MNKIKITDRESLTRATMQAHIDAPENTGSWIAKIEKRAEIVSQPAWDEIQRLRRALMQVEHASNVRYARKFASIALNPKEPS